MGKFRKRDVELVVLSDVHLGTYGCRSVELLRYLKTINPKKLILNGDIIDMWQFSKQYWPKSHMQVVKHITGLLTRKTKVTYLTGNHDEMLRKFAGFKLANLTIDNKAVLDLEGRVADVPVGHVAVTLVGGQKRVQDGLLELRPVTGPGEGLNAHSTPPATRSGSAVVGANGTDGPAQGTNRARCRALTGTSRAPANRSPNVAAPACAYRRVCATQ